MEAELIAGHGGTYRIQADGRTVFDKHQAGRFPEDNEVIEPIERMFG